jgi:hypothetical protein
MISVIFNGTNGNIGNTTLDPQAPHDDVTCRIHRDQKVSPKIKEQLWTGGCATAHARNALWTMHYWSLLQHAPDPHSASFGYMRDGKGRTQFSVVFSVL